MSQATWEVYTGVSAVGGTTVPAIKSALQALQSLNSGASLPSYAVLGTAYYDTDDDTVYLYDGTSSIAVLRVNETLHAAACIPAEYSFAVNDTTPSVKGITSAAFNNAISTTVTTFDDPTAGQLITVREIAGNTVIDAGLTATGMAIPLVAGDVLQFYYTGAAWKQVAGSVGMGRFVSVDPVDAIGDWIASSVSTATDVDVSDDGVRKGAVAALIGYACYSTNADAAENIYVRKNGSADTGHVVGYVLQNHIAGIGRVFPVGLDVNGVFEAWFTSAWTNVTNQAFVTGYWI